MRNFAYTSLKGGFAWKDVANAATLASYIPLMARCTAVDSVGYVPLKLELPRPAAPFYVIVRPILKRIQGQ